MDVLIGLVTSMRIPALGVRIVLPAIGGLKKIRAPGAESRLEQNGNTAM